MWAMHQVAELCEGLYSPQGKAPMRLTGTAAMSLLQQQLTCTAGRMRVSSSSLIMATICRMQKGCSRAELHQASSASSAFCRRQEPHVAIGKAAHLTIILRDGCV